MDKLRHSILVGKPAAEIEGEDIDGNNFKLSDYRGKVVMLEIWSIGGGRAANMMRLFG